MTAIDTIPTHADAVDWINEINHIFGKWVEASIAYDLESPPTIEVIGAVTRTITKGSEYDEFMDDMYGLLLEAIIA